MVTEHHEFKGKYSARHLRQGKKNKNAPIDANEIYKLMKLGVMRIWSLKHKNNAKV